MAHCWSVGVEIDGVEQVICTTHVPGNETLRTDIEEGRFRRPTEEELQRAVRFFKKHGPLHQRRPRRDSGKAD